MLVSSVLGKSGLASPDAPIAGALSALRAPVARATGFVMVALVGQSTSDPLDELTKMLGLFGDLSFMWHDFAGTSASTPVLTQHHEAVAERAHDALVDAVPCRTRSSATSSPTTVASPESESLNDATPSPRCDSADSTETFCGSEPFAAACLAVPPTSAANPDVSRESEVARMNFGSTAAPRPHKSSDANTHGGARRQRGSRGSNSSRRRAAVWRSP